MNRREEGSLKDGSSWNGLEITKIVVAVLIPLSVTLLGYLFTRTLKRVESSQWLNQKLIEKRIELIGAALPELNGLYCYFMRVGDWKSRSPVDVVKLKRSLDLRFHAFDAFFSPGVLETYEEFSGVLFQTFSAPGADALLRTAPSSNDGDRTQLYPDSWEPGWDRLFAAEKDRTDRAVIKNHYEALIRRCRAEVGGDPR